MKYIENVILLRKSKTLKSNKKMKQSGKYAIINLPTREIILSDDLSGYGPWTMLLSNYEYTIDSSLIRISGNNESTGKNCSIVITNYILIN